MAPGNTHVVKVTVSLPADLLAVADAHAARLSASRSRLIGLALTQLLAAEEERLAAEGYGFYASESAEFAAASAAAVGQAMHHAGQAG